MIPPDPYPITPLPGPFRLDVDFLPGSKSLTNRALLLAALAEGTSTLTNVLFADDTRVMMAALKDLGFQLDIDEPAKTVTVYGRGGKIPTRQAKLFLGNAGTAMRFLTAAVCLGEPGSVYELRGIPRMHQRPIGQLVEPLRQLGAPGMKIEYLENEGYPPLRITLSGAACGLAGREIEMDPSVSSQFVSALMMIAPFTQTHQLTIGFRHRPVSYPYIEMTRTLMESAFDCEHSAEDFQNNQWPNAVRIASNGLRAAQGAIEPDASNAGYFFAVAAITRSSIKVLRLPGYGLQGDTEFARRCLESSGASVQYDEHDNFIRVCGTEHIAGQDIDLDTMPDMAQTLAVVALFARGETIIRNVGNLRVKETDRIAALRNELTKVGAKVTVIGDDIHIVPPAGDILRHPDGTVIDEQHPVTILTYDDHRMAMSFAVAGLAHRPGGIRIADPGCVNKTYPEFFDHLKKLHDAAQSGTTR
ncbi:MAG: 3-phosphoshikimate 1-carboxyvinyltransferase [Phycisphaeraceae bacterium]